MIVLDTNLISEMMSSRPNHKVVAWLNTKKLSSLHTTWINIAEIQRGLSRLPEGKRKVSLSNKFNLFVKEAFQDRVFSFEREASLVYAMLCRERESVGLHVDPVDLMILAIAKSHGCRFATRNTADFEHCGVELINPWNT